jgi:hypothetical protein
VPKKPVKKSQKKSEPLPPIEEEAVVQDDEPVVV